MESTICIVKNKTAIEAKLNVVLSLKHALVTVQITDLIVNEAMFLHLDPHK